MQVSSAAMQALQASAVLDSAAAVEDGGALVFDSTKAIWQYEGSALVALLQERLQVCKSAACAFPMQQSLHRTHAETCVTKDTQHASLCWYLAC